MREKVIEATVYIHHAATVIGLLLGGVGLARGTKSRAGDAALSVFLLLQSFAVLKIAAEWITGEKRLLDHTRRIADSLERRWKGAKWKSPAMLCGIAGLSVLFKTGVPLLVGRRT